MTEPMQSGTGIISIFVRHPNAANLLMVLTITLGVLALGRINTQFFPTIETKQINISVSWPGASAEDVDSRIIGIIEPAVRYLDGVKRTRSYSRDGAGTIMLEINERANIDQAVANADAAVKAVTNLPAEAERPEVSEFTFYDRVARISISGDVPEGTLRIHAKKIRDDLIRLGIEKIDLDGLRDREYHVRVTDRELRRLGLSISDIAQIIASNSHDTPSGQLKGSVERQIRTRSIVDDPTALGRIEVRSFHSGEKVLLGDIATIEDGFEDGEPRGYSNGHNAIQLTIRRTPTAGTLRTAKILNTYIDAFKENLPPGIELQRYEVQADYLTERIWLLIWNGILGLVVVATVLFIFLNARIAFWVAAGIPVALLATIGMMFVLGQTINMITLFALIMMLGVIVDDAIVVGEQAATRLQAGDGPIEAAEIGAVRMFKPVTAAMVTTAAAFAPILLIQDVIGQIMGVLPYVVIAVIIASLIECFLILPGHLARATPGGPVRAWSYWRQLSLALCIGTILIVLSNRIAANGDQFEIFLGLAHLSQNYSAPAFVAMITIASLLVSSLIEWLFWIRKRRRTGADRPSPKPGFRMWFDHGFDRFRYGPFRRLVHFALRWRYATVAVAIASAMIVAVGLVRGDHVKFVFFTSPEADNIKARIVFNAGLPESRVREIVNRVEQSLFDATADLNSNKEELVTAVLTTIGQASRTIGENLAEIRVQLALPEVRHVRTPEIVAAWRQALPDLVGTRNIAIFEVRSGPPGRDLDLKISGDDVARLKRAATILLPVVSEIDGATGVADDLPYGKLELVLKLLPRGAALGFSLDEVGWQIRHAFEGAIPRRLVRGDEEVAIRVTRTRSDHGISQLHNFELRSPAGNFVPLHEVVSLQEEETFSTIQRENGKTTVSITADLNSDITTTEEAIHLLNTGSMPSLIESMGLEYSFGGRDEERRHAFVDLMHGVYVALGVIYIVLAWVFGSYFRPIAAMLIIPFGVVGAILGHWILGFNLTVLSLIGLLGLAGILVNDAIILVSRLDERLATGESLKEATLGACCDRFRAVLLTSLTTIGGLAPLLFESSLQAQFLLPMAITIVFGLSLATLLVLFLLPAIVYIGFDLGRAIDVLFGRGSKSFNENTPLAKY